MARVKRYLAAKSLAWISGCGDIPLKLALVSTVD